MGPNMNQRDLIYRYPYNNEAAEGYVTAVNILAVEYLIKTNNRAEYTRLIDILHLLDELELEDLQFNFSFNRHTSSLGAMITQGDYEYQREFLLGYLNNYLESED